MRVRLFLLALDVISLTLKPQAQIVALFAKVFRHLLLRG